MKVLLLNGSPHKEGCTYTALREVGKSLEAEGIDTQLFQLGTGPIHGCIACGKCRTSGRCIFDEDPANRCIEAIQGADGLVVGSPVYYAGPNGALCALLDRVFYASGRTFANKPAAAVVSCRRGGASASFDRLNKYFTISHMPVAASQYWNAVHGTAPEQVLQDAEGLQIMRTLGKNMAWMLKSLEHSAGAVPPPELEAPIATNFIR